mgnify:CR=1 FL=1
MEDNKLNPIFQSISDFLYEEEANIDRKKIISIGTLLCLATILMATDVMAKHSSHRSHSSHSSHSSGGSSYHSSSHGSHQSHISHTSHESSQLHSSHASGSSTHSAHSSHSSAYANHTSHTSAAHNSGFAAHSNSGIAESNAVEPVTKEIPSDEMVDIRIPLTPPDSPSMNGGTEN